MYTAKDVIEFAVHYAQLLEKELRQPSFQSAHSVFSGYHGNHLLQMESTELSEKPEIPAPPADYSILVDEDPDKLVEKVQSKILDGWRLHGDLIVVRISEKQLGYSWIQPIVRYDKTE
jgi:hypothetical protein